MRAHTPQPTAMTPKRWRAGWLRPSPRPRPSRKRLPLSSRACSPGAHPPIRLPNRKRHAVYLPEHSKTTTPGLHVQSGGGTDGARSRSRALTSTFCRSGPHRRRTPGCTRHTARTQCAGLLHCRTPDDDAIPEAVPKKPKTVQHDHANRLVSVPADQTGRRPLEEAPALSSCSPDDQVAGPPAARHGGLCASAWGRSARRRPRPAAHRASNSTVSARQI